MFGREELIQEWSDDLDTGFKVYDMVQANEVMDRMEARIKELEEACKKEKELNEQGFDTIFWQC